jgi:hypothetical protein
MYLEERLGSCVRKVHEYASEAKAFALQIQADYKERSPEEWPKKIKASELQVGDVWSDLPDSPPENHKRVFKSHAGSITYKFVGSIYEWVGSATDAHVYLWSRAEPATTEHTGQ